MTVPIAIHSRHSAERFPWTERHAVVSITDPVTPTFPGSPLPVLTGAGEVLRLSFDDLGDWALGHEVEYVEDWGRLPVFLTERDAAEIIAFARRNAEAGRSLAVHCEAGISRSAGVASILCLLLNGDESCLNDRLHRPNALVRATMKRAAGMVPTTAETKRTKPPMRAVVRALVARHLRGVDTAEEAVQKIAAAVGLATPQPSAGKPQPGDAGEGTR